MLLCLLKFLELFSKSIKFSENLENDIFNSWVFIDLLKGKLIVIYSLLLIFILFELIVKKLFLKAQLPE